MAAPNLLSPTTVNGKAALLTLSSTTETTLLTNASGSNKFVRINALYAANIDGLNNVDCTIKLYDAATGGTGYALANTVNIPADATVVMVGHDAPLYLEENRRVTVTASAASDLTVICSYEEVS